MEQQKIVELVGRPRPQDVPPEWIVYNAPRPLYGHKEWTGEFVTGLFYAAVDPQGDRAEFMMERNQALDARILVFLDPELWAARVNAYGQMMAEEYGVDLDEFDHTDVEFSYVNYLNEQGQRVLLGPRTS